MSGALVVTVAESAAVRLAVRVEIAGGILEAVGAKTAVIGVVVKRAGARRAVALLAAAVVDGAGATSPARAS